MKIILSPAKQMKFEFGKEVKDTPVFLKKSQSLYQTLSSLSFSTLKALYLSSDKIVSEAQSYWEDFSFTDHLTPALFAYSGIAFTYMEIDKLSEDALLYLENHLLILSAFYGVLTPFTGVSKYRLEMNNKYAWDRYSSFYDYWGDDLYTYCYSFHEPVVNLASEEYASAIRRYLKKEDSFIDVMFYERENGRLTEKGVYCKMARGRLTRYLAMNHIQDINDIKKWNEMGYHYSEEHSSENKIVFIRSKSACY